MSSSTTPCDDTVAVILSNIEARFRELRERHPPDFQNTPRDLRAAIALIGDELNEVLEAWEAERRRWGQARTDLWSAMEDELLDVAGVAVRAMLAIHASAA